MTITPFTIPNPSARLAQIKTRVAEYEWHEMPEIKAGDNRWAYGTDMTYLRSLCTYWLEKYDWQDTLAELNAFPHFTAAIEGHTIHFIKEEGSGKNPRALLMTHGWPGSVYEFLQVIEPLAHPERFGGDAEQGVSVICPSLPGYGFSSKPKTPIGQMATAALWDKLMRDVLGYDTYIAQGGDWGSVVTAALGLHHNSKKGGGCVAIHINMYGLRGTEAPESAEEVAWAKHAQSMMQQEGAYFQLQSTKPQSLSYAMMDSPVGLGAWILEKFHGWSDLKNNDIESRYTKHQLLSNIMIYLITRSFNTSTWYYRAFVEELGHIPDGQKVEVPVGVGAFQDKFLSFPPRRMIEHSYNVIHWRDHKSGGHFAALEEPAAFVEEVQSFLAKL